jgi:ATP-dependent helicase YprA (DUF1998 family)
MLRALDGTTIIFVELIGVSHCVLNCPSALVAQYDPDKGMGLLVETWVSQANAKQRQGRAGRVQKGNCYRLYTRRKFQSLDAQQVVLSCLSRTLAFERLFVKITPCALYFFTL